MCPMCPKRISSGEYLSLLRNAVKCPDAMGHMGHLGQVVAAPSARIQKKGRPPALRVSRNPLCYGPGPTA